MVSDSAVCKADGKWMVLTWLPPLTVASWAALAWPEYSHLRHSLSQLAAHAPWLGILLFLWPGLGMAWHAHRTRDRLPEGSGLGLRLAWQMALLAALAFALQGVLPFDAARPADEDANRLHVLAGMLWWLCLWLMAGCAMLARTLPGKRRLWMALLWLAIPALALLAPAFTSGALALRLAILLWILMVLIVRGGRFRNRS
ncbi:hypothetical protein CO615_00750 [Lysobacteraceae bacterium NML75-0749]|nr:hypothetical protein CO609_10150 [Xanthomonadaceae bacterium NML91-0268]PJK03598.1 hypothetical protein CO615_00750 [Xanthomonadaceae bacterium NML75-0749]